jgi:hypothetical protein
MAILSDGTTELDIDYVDERIDPIVEETTSRTAGGSLRQITGGQRLRLFLDMRLTPSQYNTLLSILVSNTNNYFYTPEESTSSYWSDLYPSVTFPINVIFSNQERDWDNRKYWYVKLQAETTSYI